MSTKVGHKKLKKVQKLIFYNSPKNFKVVFGVFLTLSLANDVFNFAPRIVSISKSFGQNDSSEFFWNFK